MTDLTQLTEFLPFLIPLIVAELALFGYTLYHILSHKTYKRGALPSGWSSPSSS